MWMVGLGRYMKCSFYCLHFSSWSVDILSFLVYGNNDEYDCTQSLSSINLQVDLSPFVNAFVEAFYLTKWLSASIRLAWS